MVLKEDVEKLMELGIDEEDAKGFLESKSFDLDTVKTILDKEFEPYSVSVYSDEDGKKVGYLRKLFNVKEEDGKLKIVEEDFPTKEGLEDLLNEVNGE